MNALTPYNRVCSAGSLATLLLWIYCQAQVFFLGAEFTRVYAKIYGSKSGPGKHLHETSREHRTVNHAS